MDHSPAAVPRSLHRMLCVSVTRMHGRVQCKYQPTACLRHVRTSSAVVLIYSVAASFSLGHRIERDGSRRRLELSHYKLGTPIFTHTHYHYTVLFLHTTLNSLFFSIFLGTSPFASEAEPTDWYQPRATSVFEGTDGESDPPTKFEHVRIPGCNWALLYTSGLS